MSVRKMGFTGELKRRWRKTKRFLSRDMKDLLVVLGVVSAIVFMVAAVLAPTIACVLGIVWLLQNIF